MPEVLIGVQALLNRLESPQLIETLGNELARTLAYSAPVYSGATQRALLYVGPPQRTARGWRIGVGKGADTGQPGDTLPTGVLRQFYDYLEGQGVKVRHTKWDMLSRSNKDAYESFRRSGAATGFGPDSAFYMWIQDKRHPYLEAALTEFRSNAGNIIKDYLKNR